MSTYADSGVDIDKGNAIVRRIKAAVRSTHTPRVLADIGLFGGLYDAATIARDPVMVSSIDGVGTKLHVAAAAGRFHGIGRDIVAHCCDDIVVQGARPLFFLDYIAAAHLTEEAVAALVEGMTEECRYNACALLGGETAEMPGTYMHGQYDVVGCIVGVVEREALITGADISEGDRIVGLASSGLHTNGYSLARKVLFTDAGLQLDDIPEGCDASVADLLLAPHRSYAPLILSLMEMCSIKGLAHITGGGLVENVPRILPASVSAHITTSAMPVPPLFSFMQQSGNIAKDEMYRVFNMGIGMTVIVAPDAVDTVIAHAQSHACEAHEIGVIEKGDGRVVLQ